MFCFHFGLATKFDLSLKSRLIVYSFVTSKYMVSGILLIDLLNIMTTCLSCLRKELSIGIKVSR